MPSALARARSDNVADGNVALARRSALWKTARVACVSCAQSRGAASSRCRSAARLRSPATLRPSTRDCSPAATGTTCPRSPGSSSPVVGELETQRKKN